MKKGYRVPKKEEFVGGFKYQSFIGYCWEDVEFPDTGISDMEGQLELAIGNGSVRVKTVD